MIELKESSEQPSETASVKNVELKKNVVLKAASKIGDIAHYHKQEDEEKTWEEACFVVGYQILDEKGFRINDDRYVGYVVVSQCMADQLAYMDANRAIYERDVFHGKTRTRQVASL